MITLKKREDELEAEVFSGKYEKCSSIAFVTFKTDHEADVFLETYKSNFKTKLKSLFSSSQGGKSLIFKN